LEQAVTARAHRTLLAISFGGGMLLRFVGIGDRPLWYDEAFSILLSRQALPQIISGTAADTMPPLFYLLLHLWMKSGSGIGYLRLLSVLLGGGVLVLAYFWGRQLGGARVGLWMLTLAAVSPFLIYHAQELRMYSLLALTTLGYIILVHRWCRNALGREPWNGLGIALLGGLALYSHNLAGFTLLVPNLILLIRGRWRTMLRLALPQLGALLLFSPWLRFVPGQIDKIQGAFWTPEPGVLEVVQVLIAMHTNLPVPDALLPLALFGSLTTLTLLVYGLVRIGGISGSGIGEMAGYLVLPPIILFLMSYIMRPVFVPRAFIVSIIAYYGLLATFLMGNNDRYLRLLIVVSFMLPIAVTLPAQYRYEYFPRSPFEKASSYLSQEAGEGDLILHDNKLSYFPMAIYSPDLRMSYLPDEPGSHNDTLAPETQDALGLWPVKDLSQSTRGVGSIWFVVFERAIAEYLDQGLQDHPKIELLRSEFVQVGEMRFNDLLVLRFEAP
jgi:uncharacterized membrane protein